MNIDISIVTSGGCIVEVNGEVSVSFQTSNDGLTKVVYGGFKGTVSISGGSGCPNVTATFKSGRAPTGKELSVSVDSRNISKLSKMTWRGNTRAIRILNESTVNEKLCRAIKAKARTVKA